MDYGFEDKEQKLRSEIRKFVKENMPPDRFWGPVEEGDTDEEWSFFMSMSKKLAKKNWLAISWPKEYGGMGASHMQKLVFDEEVGYWGIPGTSMGVSGTGWVGPSLILFGTDEQKRTFLPPIASGDEDGVWCTGYSEPDAGSDLASMQTYAKKVGDEYIINGQKVWTSSAHRSRWMWLAARTKQDVQNKHDGISLFLVDMQSKGIQVNPLLNFIGAHMFNEVFFNDVRIPIKNLVGAENKGWSQLMAALSFERGIAVNMTAATRRILDELVEFAKETGRIRDPVIRSRLADATVELEKSRFLGYESAWKAASGIRITYEPSRDKADADELMELISRIGVDLLGGYSLLDPMDRDNKWTQLFGNVERFYYNTIGMSVAAGTTDTQRNIVANLGLDLPRF